MRVLTPIMGTQWKFYFSAGTLQAPDDDIHSIVITRGVSGRNVGHNPNIVEVSLDGRKDTFLTGSKAQVFIRPDPAARLAAFVGSTAAAISQRFYGRLSTIKIEDRGGEKFSTQMAGSSFLTQMNYSPASFTPAAGNFLGTIYTNMTRAAEPIRGVMFSSALMGAVNMSHNAAGEQMLFRDGVGPMAADIGVVFQERRNGETKALGIPYRIEDTATRVTNEFPLMRNQAIAPGEYEQPNERPAIRVEYKIVNETGGIATRVAEIANPTGELVETVSIDWTRWKVSNVQNQLVREAYARVFGSSARLYQIPVIKVDMLMLLQNGGEYARRIAKQVLEMEVCDPVMLSGDWPARLRGVHFAEGIKETITPDSWEFELSLMPHAAVTGNISPEVKPRAWDSFTYDWQTETREWNQA